MNQSTPWSLKSTESHSTNQLLPRHRWFEHRHTCKRSFLRPTDGNGSPSRSFNNNQSSSISCNSCRHCSFVDPLAQTPVHRGISAYHSPVSSFSKWVVFIAVLIYSVNAGIMCSFVFTAVNINISLHTSIRQLRISLV